MLTITAHITLAGTTSSPGIVLAPPRPGTTRRVAWTFLNELEAREYDKFEALIRRLADRGEIVNDQDFKWLSGGANKTFELKTNLHRLYGFHHDELGARREQRAYILTNGGTKRSQKATKQVKQDYARAETLRNELLAEK